MFGIIKIIFKKAQTQTKATARNKYVLQTDVYSGDDGAGARIPESGRPTVTSSRHD